MFLGTSGPPDRQAGEPEPGCLEMSTRGRWGGMGWLTPKTCQDLRWPRPSQAQGHGSDTPNVRPQGKFPVSGWVRSRWVVAARGWESIIQADVDAHSTTCRSACSPARHLCVKKVLLTPATGGMHGQPTSSKFSPGLTAHGEPAQGQFFEFFPYQAHSLSSGFRGRSTSNA